MKDYDKNKESSCNQYWNVKAKYGEKAKFNCFIVYIKTDDFYKVIAEDVKTRFDTFKL